MPVAARPPEERFDEKWVVSAEHFHDGTPCWDWTASLRNGYGAFHDGTRATYAHLFNYKRLVGPVPEGLHLDHLCRRPICCNPAHLEPVLPRENYLRGTGFSAVNAAKTHCVHGHPFDEENTYYPPKREGARDCRTCRRLYQRFLRMEKEAAGVTA